MNFTFGIISLEKISFSFFACVLGLRLIDENGSGIDSEEDEKLLRRISPVIPLVVPLALKPRCHYQTEVVSFINGNQ